MSSPISTTVRFRPMFVIAGAAALALAGVALVGIQGDAAAEETAPHGPMADGPRHARAHEHAPADHAVRSEHLAELAERSGIDPDAFIAAMADLRVDFATEREAMRVQMADLAPEERRAVMVAFAEDRRAMMAEALAELGIDPAVLAEHRAGHERVDHDGAAAQAGQHGGQRRMAGPLGQVRSAS